MRSFRTDFTLSPDPFLQQNRPIFTLGSCFAEHIGQKLLDYKWQGLNAPFGALFHPLALNKVLRLAIEHADLDEALFVEHEGAIFHHDLHSRFYAASHAELQSSWHELASSVRVVLKNEPYILLTLGTAWVYERKTGGQLVANCHKRPADQFEKRLLRSEEIRDALDNMLRLLPASSPIIISLSPVRHTRDTMVGNSLSKSLLLIHIHELAAKNPTRVRYFPAYEVMLDDLRDYRFYEADMIHPSAEAIDYIWDKFTSCYASEPTKQFLHRWQKVLGTLRHRPQRCDAPSYQKYLRELLQEMNSLIGIDCSEERAELQSRLLS